jgi:PKD repeat protein
MRANVYSLLLITASALAPSISLAQAPICDANGPYTGQVGVAVPFDGTGSIAIPPHMIVLYEWQFGDGGTGTGPTPTHVYAAQGAYNVSLIVTDDDNLQSHCSTTAEITPPTAFEPRTWGWIKAIYR